MLVNCILTTLCGNKKSLASLSFFVQAWDWHCQSANTGGVEINIPTNRYPYTALPLLGFSPKILGFPIQSWVLGFFSESPGFFLGFFKELGFFLGFSNLTE